MKLNSPYTSKCGTWWDNSSKSTYLGLFFIPWHPLVHHFSCSFPGNSAIYSYHFLLVKRKHEIRIVRFYKHLSAWEMQSSELFHKAAGDEKWREEKRYDCILKLRCLPLLRDLKRQEFKLSIWMLKQDRLCNDPSRRTAAIRVLLWMEKGRKHEKQG